jgi:NAD(P)H dehydrogenase (quinone)
MVYAPNVEIVAYSDAGHTLRQAEALRDGAAMAGRATIRCVSDEGTLTAADWDALDAADCIVFGSPTYLGGPAWQMKRVADATSDRWMERRWQDKLAGGFANGGAPSGNSSDVLAYFWTLASQHGMVWASLGQAPANAGDDDASCRNWLGGSGGALACSPVDLPPEEAPRAGDLASARDYGTRLAELAAILAHGREETRRAA